MAVNTGPMQLSIFVTFHYALHLKSKPLLRWICGLKNVFAWLKKCKFAKLKLGETNMANTQIERIASLRSAP